MKKLTVLFILSLFLGSCSKQQARKPISQSSGSFIKESIERNKILIAKEEQDINQFIKNDSLNEYISSPKGYWFSYKTKVNEDTKVPLRGDVAYFDYEIKSLDGKLIYSKEQLKPQIYFIDKENILNGLRDGIKIMKKGEEILFLFPSHVAYGYHGDNDKIGTNIPILCTVTLNDIKIENSNN
ncbi:gliding motility-associated peptidyl-prolyl isomerase GldI [uncultured Flavobacterium sp.]|uniref:gliding motility-associated peptidyl-prolyl isomerase GldI n=1 Tax=uncultured Flavobacterium sp. TaxID=165435 RepID=UPI0030CA4184|tara:strand:- start:398 stop:946 length:549 start_codon:yes stop_codon:yes gene_type:complete